eukprot:TRINITY_DN6347_c0_g1_i1.p1 TRINITY_DN6347_c0_g1~~TRINITY_DN6347_c0_g1_i1.p1  ORF type:complete len:131 (-),score=22.31 TRINITY_DN6347_c0_g1_i1:202-594(-)
MLFLSMKPEQIQKVNTLSILRKSTFLTYIAIFSTQILIMIGAIFEIGAILASIDCVINAWCIMLIFNRYQSLYDRLCGQCEGRLTIGCLAFCACTCCCDITDGKSQLNLSTIAEKEVQSDDTKEIQITTI